MLHKEFITKLFPTPVHWHTNGLTLETSSFRLSVNFFLTMMQQKEKRERKKKEKETFQLHTLDNQ